MSCCQLYHIHLARYRQPLRLLPSVAEQDCSVQGLQIFTSRLVHCHDEMVLPKISYAAVQKAYPTVQTITAVHSAKPRWSGVKTYHAQPMMYRATAFCHRSAVCTLSQEKPIAIAMTVRTINIFGLHVPKSACISFVGGKAAEMGSNGSTPAKLPSNKNTTTCMQNEMPLHRRTMLLTVRSLSLVSTSERSS